MYVHATAVNNLLRRDALVEFGRISTGIASFALAALAVAAALVLGPTGAVLAFLGIAAAWSAGATIAFRDALAVPLVEPLLTALACAWRHDWLSSCRRRPHDGGAACPEARARGGDGERRSHSAGNAAEHAAEMTPPRARSIFSRDMIPAREVGGDLYDIVKLDENRVVITIGDVCGKGVPASLFMAISQTVMRLVVHSGEDLQAEIEAANKLLAANNRRRDVHDSILRRASTCPPAR